MKRFNFISILCLTISLFLLQPIKAQSTYYRSVSEEIPIYNDEMPKNLVKEGTIKAVFNIYTNDKLKELSDIKFQIINKSRGLNVTLDMSEQFTAFLDYNQDYVFKIGHKQFSTKSLNVLTKAPEDQDWVLTCNIYLYSNEPDSYAGKLVYDSKFKTFKHYQ